MRFSLSSIALVVVCSLASVVVAQSSDVIGPITTNNGISACVQFGSCTTGTYATSETQLTPVTSPASSVHYAEPTDSAESAASISNLAATGAAAAYSSRVANGQGSGNAPDGATSVALTGTAIGGTAPASTKSATGKGSTDAGYNLDSGFRGIWTAAVAFVAVIAGALVVL